MTRMRLTWIESLVALCAWGLPAAADESVAVMVDGTRVSVAESMQQDATLTDLCFVDARTGWAVGDRGVIWHTVDGGRTWRQQASGTSCRLNTVSFADGRHGWAAGGNFEPISHAPRGIVLATVDGGQTWQSIAPPTLPLVTRIKFFDGRHGVAVGVGTSAEPSGAFATHDGGRSWQPLPSDSRGHWLAADFVDADTGAVAGPGGQFASLARRQLVRNPAALELTRSFRALRLAPPTGGWLVGDGGLVMTTRDLGHSWQTPPDDLPPGAGEQFDFHAVATLGPHVWIAGAPGTRVFHSPDGGQHWRTLATGVHAPLRALAFVDANTGWAAGELGTILATHDGGQTWHVQRQGGRRTALLAVLARGADAPLELLAKHGAEEGYLAAVEIIQTGTPLDETRNSQAMSLAGATAAQSAWRFATPADDARSLDELVAALDRANDGRALARLEGYLVRALRMWRPEVVVTRHVEEPNADPLAALTEQLMLRAVQAAGDSAQYAQLATDVGLTPWQVKRVFGLLPAGARGDVRIAASEFAPRLGCSLADAATPARQTLFAQHTSAAELVELAELNRQARGDANADDLFSGIRLAPGSEARRRLAHLPEEDLEQLRRMAARRRQMQTLLERTPDNAAWEAQIADLTDGLDAAGGGELLFQLADGYRASGRADLAADTYAALARRWPEHPLVDAALRWLVQYYASSETARRAHFNGQPAQHDSDVQQASATDDSTSTPVVGLSRDDRLRRAAMLGQYLESTRPALYAEPSIRFPLVAAQRQLGFANPAKRYFLTLGARPADDPWRRCAETEAWLANPEGLPPPKALGTCRRTSERPHLDGKLDEPLWNAVDRLRLRFPHTSEEGQATSEVRFAYDQQFLYFAITAPHAPGNEVTPDDRPRPRDADLAAFDRLSVKIDIDRDYTTAFELSVDARGWTHDACWGDAAWNPTWYVAAARDDAAWTIEAAVPLAELVDEPPAAKHVWAVSLVRSIPNGGRQSWAGGDIDADSPDQFGLLIFE